MVHLIAKRGNATYYHDPETDDVLYVKKRRSGDWNKTALGVLNERDGYIVYFDHGKITDIKFKCNDAQCSLEDRTNAAVLTIINSLQQEWEKSSYRELFIVDKYAAQNMYKFREIWDKHFVLKRTA